MLGVVHAPHGPTLGADDHGQYLLHGKALADGRPYADIGFIHTPYSTKVAPITEPPGLPLLIAAVFEVTGPNAQPVRTVLYVSFALLGLIVFLYFQPVVGLGKAALVVAWSLTALARQHTLDTVLADLPFCAALWTCFYLADNAAQNLRRRFAALAVTGASAFAFRLAALPLSLGAFVAAWTRRQNRTEARGYFALGMVWAAVAAAVMFGLHAADTLAGETLRSPATFARDAFNNLREMSVGARLGVPLTIPSQRARIAIHAVALTIAFIGLVGTFRAHRSRFAWTFGVCYVAMLVALPGGSPRYMWPLYPFLAFGFLEGLERIARTIPRLTRAAVPATVTFLIVAIGVLQDVAAPAPPTYATLPEISAVRAALERESLRPGDLRVVVFSPRVMTWEDGYTTMAPFDASPDEQLRVLRRNRITHIVLGDAGTRAPATDAMRRLVIERPRAFQEIFANSLFRIVSLRPNGMER